MLITIPLQKSQQEILLNKSKVRTIIAARRWGKSTTLAADQLTSAMKIPNGNSLLINPQQYQSNNFYKQMYESNKVMPKCYQDPWLLPKGVKNPKTSPYPHIVFKGGHTLDMRTWGSVEGSVGGYLDRVYLDESADFDSDLVFKTYLPKLADKRGLMMVAGTVTTESSFLWQMYQRGLSRDKRYSSWLFKWSDCIVYQGKAGEAELKFLYDTMSTLDFQTQLECMPVGDNNTAFPNLNRCVIDIEPPPRPQGGRRYCMVADLARTRDFTYVVIIDDTGLVVYEEQMPRNLDYAVYAKKCADLATIWQVGDAFTFDDTGCGGSGGQRTTEKSISKIYKDAYPQARPWTWSGNSEHQSKHEVVQHFNCLTQEKRAFKGNDGKVTDLPKLRIPRKFDRLIKQLDNYKALVSKITQKLVYQGKFGHDDGASALILCAWRAFKQGIFGPIVGDNVIYISGDTIQHLE